MTSRRIATNSETELFIIPDDLIWPISPDAYGMFAADRLDQYKRYFNEVDLAISKSILIPEVCKPRTCYIVDEFEYQLNGVILK